MRRWGIVIRNMSLSVGLVIIGLSGCVAPSDEVRPGSSAPNLDEVIVIFPDEGAPHEPEPTGPDRDPSFSYDFDDDVDHSAAPPAHASPSPPDGIGEAADGDYAYLIDLTDEEEAAAEAPIESGEASDAVGDQTSAGEGDEELAGDDAALPPEEDDQNEIDNGFRYAQPDEIRQMSKRFKGIYAASRMFDSQKYFPPKVFEGYGIIAARKRPVDQDVEKFRIICREWFNRLTSVQVAQNQGFSKKFQLVTIWPVKSKSTADALNAAEQSTHSDQTQLEQAQCESAIANYSHLFGRAVIDRAKLGYRAAGISSEQIEDWFRDDGPFLLAWRRSDTGVEQEFPVFCADMSSVTHPNHARDIFREWIRRVNDNELGTTGKGECQDMGVLFAFKLWLDADQHALMNGLQKILELMGIKSDQDQVAE